MLCFLSEVWRFCSNSDCYFELFIIPPNLFMVLVTAEEKNSPNAWCRLHHTFRDLLALSNFVFASNIPFGSMAKNALLGCMNPNNISQTWESMSSPADTVKSILQSVKKTQLKTKIYYIATGCTLNILTTQPWVAIMFVLIPCKINMHLWVSTIIY